MGVVVLFPSQLSDWSVSVLHRKCRYLGDIQPQRRRAGTLRPVSVPVEQREWAGLSCDWTVDGEPAAERESMLQQDGGGCPPPRLPSPPPPPLFSLLRFLFPPFNPVSPLSIPLPLSSLPFPLPPSFGSSPLCDFSLHPPSFRPSPPPKISNGSCVMSWRRRLC